MTAATPSRVGQINATGDTLAMFLKVFGGEVLTHFRRQAQFRQRHMSRSISSGKSAQFPVLGQTTAYTHTPGDELLGQKIKGAERVIAIEGLKVAPVFIANIDEAMSHFDVRGPYAQEIGYALARLFDQDVAHTLINAARITTPTVLDTTLGNTLTSTSNNALYATDGTVLFNAFGDVMATMDVRDIPREGRYQAVRPVQFALLIKSEKPIDRRLNPGDNLGGYSQGVVYDMWGAPIISTNNLAATDDRANTEQPTSRRVDYTVTQGLAWHESAAGTVSLKDVMMEGQYDMRRQGWLMLGKFLAGHDVLRPEAAFELRTGNPTP